MRVGDEAPDFTSTDQSGADVRLSDLLEDGPVVLFFYPKAFSPGCTMESCHFRDLAAAFAAAGAQRVGISADNVGKQAEFATAHRLDYPLLSDPDGSIAGLFGVKRPGPLLNKRMTFVIDTDRCVLDVIGSEFDMNSHADKALAALTRK
ncbi:MAG TPA: peroxiredoxin [Acidimicrobiia bacterium]|nr:peroxiredoxin [Acidimicrobiia bacterium]